MGVWPSRPTASQPVSLYLCKSGRQGVLSTACQWNCSLLLRELSLASSPLCVCFCFFASCFAECPPHTLLLLLAMWFSLHLPPTPTLVWSQFAELSLRSQLAGDFPYWFLNQSQLSLWENTKQSKWYLEEAQWWLERREAGFLPPNSDVEAHPLVGLYWR